MVNENLDQVTMFPNPASSHVNFSIRETMGDYTIRVFDKLGRLVSETRNKNCIDVSDITAGIYFVMITTQTETTAAKALVITK